MAIDFENVYSWFGGTIYPGRDCGIDICGNSACCYPHYYLNRPSYIFYLPDELEFLRSRLGTNCLAREVVPGSGRYHCYGRQKCTYELRPIDCRSFPYWPVVGEEDLLGFIDLRKPRCPIKRLPYRFLEEMHDSWSRLLTGNPSLIEWFKHEAPKPEGVFLPLALVERRL